MYILVARIFDKRELVGYKMRDMVNGEDHFVTKDDACRLAANMQIVDTKCIQSKLGSGSLVSTGSIRLRDLPRIDAKGIKKKSVSSNKFKYSDKIACVIRDTCNNRRMSTVYTDSHIKELIKQDVNRGVIDISEKNSLSMGILIRKCGSNEYMVLNENDYDLPFHRIADDKDKIKQVETLGSHDQQLLSKAELVLLSSNPKINCIFSNALVIGPTKFSRYTGNLEGWLNQFSIVFGNNDNQDGIN